MATQFDLWEKIHELSNSNKEFEKIVVEIETRDAENKALRKAYQLMETMGAIEPLLEVRHSPTKTKRKREVLACTA